MSKKFDKFMKSSMHRLSEKAVHKTVETVRRRSEVMKKQFWPLFVTKVIGARSAPNLGKYTPTWKPLGSKSVQGGFFYDTGRLKNILKRRKISYTSNHMGETEVKILNIRTLASGKVTARIRTDPFPKITSLDNDTLVRQLFTQKQGWKIANFRGAFDRPIMAEYIRWYTQFKIKRFIRGKL